MPESLKRNLYRANLRLADLVDALDTWFEAQRMDMSSDVDDSPTTRGENYTLIAKSQGLGWRKAAGLAVELHIQLLYEDPSLEVLVDMGSFKGQGAVAATGIAGSMVIPILLPLAATAAVGAARQALMPDRCMTFIESWLKTSEAERGSNRYSAPIASARDHGDDYEVLMREAGSPPAPPKEEDLVLSDFDPAPAPGDDIRDGRHGRGNEDLASTPTINCRICGSSSPLGALVCPNGHRL